MFNSLPHADLSTLVEESFSLGQEESWLCQAVRGRGPGLTTVRTGVIQEGVHFSLSMLQKDPRPFPHSATTPLPTEEAVRQAQGLETDD